LSDPLNNPGRERGGRWYDPVVIVDFHTHVFPPSMIGAKKESCRRDAAFGAIYRDPRTKLATAEDLLESMSGAGIDVSGVLGFAWSAASNHAPAKTC